DSVAFSGNNLTWCVRVGKRGFPMSSFLKPPRVFIFLLMISFASFSAVLFTPSFPLLVRDFGLSAGETQFTVTIFLVGYALGQLPYGPLANRFGRKKALYAGLVLALAGTLLAL